MVNINKLKGKIVESGMNIEKLANKIGIDKSTLYRKLTVNGESITIKEATLIAKELKLTHSEVNSIFFDCDVAYNAK